MSWVNVTSRHGTLIVEKTGKAQNILLHPWSKVWNLQRSLKDWLSPLPRSRCYTSDSRSLFSKGRKRSISAMEDRGKRKGTNSWKKSGIAVLSHLLLLDTFCFTDALPHCCLFFNSQHIKSYRLPSIFADAQYPGDNFHCHIKEKIDKIVCFMVCYKSSFMENSCFYLFFSLILFCFFLHAPCIHLGCCLPRLYYIWDKLLVWESYRDRCSNFFQIIANFICQSQGSYKGYCYRS